MEAAIGVVKTLRVTVIKDRGAGVAVALLWNAPSTSNAAGWNGISARRDFAGEARPGWV
jgi:hypothetical protein